VIFRDVRRDQWVYAIYSKDLGLQNTVSSIDPVTGRKNINPQTLPGDGQSHMVCPHVDGAKSWLPGSYNPDTKILYVPLIEACMDLTPVTDGGRGLLSAGGRPTVRPRPDSDGKYGRVEAINMVTRLRRPNGQTAMGNASERCAEQRPDFVHGERKAVHRYRRGQRRRAGDRVRAFSAGNPERRPLSGGVGVPTALTR
jgi:hypothetical protein